MEDPQRRLLRYILATRKVIHGVRACQDYHGSDSSSTRTLRWIDFLCAPPSGFASNVQACTLLWNVPDVFRWRAHTTGCCCSMFIHHKCQTPSEGWSKDMHMCEDTNLLARAGHVCRRCRPGALDSRHAKIFTMARGGACWRGLFWLSLQAWKESFCQQHAGALT